MTITRREFLQIGSAITLSSTIGSSTVNPVLGLIAPPSDYPVPDEAITLYASRVQFKVFGLGLPAMTPEGYDSVIDKMTPAAVKLAKEGANAIVLFGTSMTFYKGAKFNEELIAQARKATSLPVTSMSTAVIDGLRAAGGKRIAVATAYNDEVNRRLKAFLGESGFEVLALKGLGLESINGPKQVPQSDLQKFSASVFEMAPKADALLVSCGGLRTLEIIQPLENICKVPVVSSTPHALWAGVKLLRVSTKVPGFGKVLAM